MEMAQVTKRTRAQAALTIGAATTSPKKTKIHVINNNTSSPSSSTCASSTAPAAEERCSSPNSDDSPGSCCSSNGFFYLDEKRITKLSDPEVESAQVETTSTCNCDDQIISVSATESTRRKMSLSSELRINSPGVESPEKKPTSPHKMPTDSELEEFFAAAEKDIQKQFLYKYNYDIVKDVPLEGRYEWVQLKP